MLNNAKNILQCNTRYNAIQCNTRYNCILYNAIYNCIGGRHNMYMYSAVRLSGVSLKNNNYYYRVFDTMQYTTVCDIALLLKFRCAYDRTSMAPSNCSVIM